MKSLFNIIKVFTLICFAASCSAINPAPIERKEQFYYSKNGVVKLVRIIRDQSIRELAHSYGIEAEILAKINSRSLNSWVARGEVIKIPLSSDVQFKEQLFDEGELNYNDSIEGTPLTAEEQSEKEHTNEFTLLTDGELNRDLNFNKELNKDLSINIANNAAVTKKGEFKFSHPLNSKQFIWPVDGKILSRYGKSGESFNEGINIAAPLGMVVRSAADGEVMYVGKEPKVYGNLVIIKHANNYLTAYAHNDKINVAKGTKVKQGQPIATIGKTGAVSIPQLHFSMRKDKKTINPEG